jgi:protein-disulfide isomerase
MTSVNYFKASKDVRYCTDTQHNWNKDSVSTIGVPMNTLTSSNTHVQITALTADDHSLGSANGSVTLLEYGDYECPACALAEPLTRHLVDTLGENGRFVFRHFPLVEVHPNAQLAAEAAEAAAAQGKFWEMHHMLFSTPHHLTLADLTKHAEAIGLDMTRFIAEMADHLYTQRIQEHRLAGEMTHLRATPAFFLNGKLVDVSFGLDKLEEAVHAMTAALAI